MERLPTGEQLRILGETWDAATSTNQILSPEGMGIIMPDDFSSTVHAVSYARELRDAGKWQREQTAAEPLRGRAATSILFLSALKWARAGRQNLGRDGSDLGS